MKISFYKASRIFPFFNRNDFNNSANICREIFTRAMRAKVSQTVDTFVKNFHEIVHVHDILVLCNKKLGFYIYSIVIYWIFF